MALSCAAARVALPTGTASCCTSAVSGGTFAQGPQLLVPAFDSQAKCLTVQGKGRRPLFGSGVKELQQRWCKASEVPHCFRGKRRSIRMEARKADAVSEAPTEEEVVDRQIGDYCSINKEDKKSLGEMEQDFLAALQSFYFDKEPIMSNEEFDNLKEELQWQGSRVVILSSEEQKFMEAVQAYFAGKPILSDAEFDELKRQLKKSNSKVTFEGPRCSLRSRKVYSDSQLDYVKMTLLNLPAAIVSLAFVFLFDDLTGFEITYLLELPEPWSALFAYFVVFPVTLFLTTKLTSVVIKDPLILKGPCPNCGAENTTFFGTILTVPSPSDTNPVKCESCSTALKFERDTRLILIDEDAPADKGPKSPPRPKRTPAKKPTPAEA